MTKSKKILVFSLIVAASLILVLSIDKLVNYHIPELGRQFFGKERYTDVETINEQKIKIPKLTLAKACNTQLSECVDDVLLVSGEINTATLKSISELSKQSLDTDVDTLCLNSIGGSVETANLINEFVVNNNYNTCLASRYIIKDLGENNTRNSLNEQVVVKHESCYSACPLVIATAKKRILLGDSFIIGVHSSGYKVFNKLHVDDDGDKYEKFISYEMMPFFEFTRTVPSKYMYILSEHQVRTSMLFNDYRGSRENVTLFKSLKSCESEYLISSECPIEGVTDPYKITL